MLKCSLIKPALCWDQRKDCFLPSQALTLNATVSSPTLSLGGGKAMQSKGRALLEPSRMLLLPSLLSGLVCVLSLQLICSSPSGSFFPLSDCNGRWEGRF